MKYGMSTKHVTRWRRPRLPVEQRSAGVAWGILLLLAGAFCFVYPAWRFLMGGFVGAAGLLPIAGGALSMLGLLVTCVSIIQNEIRQMAFEAAVRAGEVAPRPRAGQGALGSSAAEAADEGGAGHEQGRNREG